MWYLVGLGYTRHLLRTYWTKLKAELLDLKGNPKLREIQSTSLTIYAGSVGKNLANTLLSVVLIGRQNPFSLALSRALKRSDTMSLKGDLKNKPLSDFELLNRNYYLTPALLTHAFKAWGQENIVGTELVYCWKYGKLPLAPELKKVANLWRISIRKDSPNILVTLSAGKPKSARLLEWVANLDLFLARLAELSEERTRR